MLVFNLPWKRMLSASVAIVFAGCSIIPEDAVETLPDNLTLKQIVATSNVQTNFWETSDLPSETLTGKVSVAGDKTSLTFSGDLDLHGFPEKLSTMSYTQNGGLLTTLTLTFADGKTLSESYTYDSQKRLTKATVVNDGMTEVDDFFYIGVVLDSIAKKVTYSDGKIDKGFFKLHDDEFSEPKFISVFPHLAGGFPPNVSGCNSVSQEEYGINYSEFSLNNYGGQALTNGSVRRIKEATPDGDADQYDYKTLWRSQSLSINKGAIDQRLKDIHFSYYDCEDLNRAIQSVPYYTLIHNMPYETMWALWMLAEAREGNTVIDNPDYMSSIETLIIDFQYESK